MTPLEEYEQFLAKQRLTFPIDRTIEFDGVPPFAPVFEEDPYVSQEGLWWKYWGRYRETLPTYMAPGLMARCYRAYPSLVRDHHLYLLLDASGGFDLVVRDGKLDKHGVDFLLFTDQEVYAVAAYVDTERSRTFRQRKKVRHIPIGALTIELPLDMEQGVEVGPFKLYGPQHVDTIWSAIRAYREPVAEAA